MYWNDGMDLHSFTALKTIFDRECPKYKDEIAAGKKQLNNQASFGFLFGLSGWFYAVILQIEWVGTEVEIQLRWRGPPDSSVSSLNLFGWCEEGHPATKNSLQLSQG